MGESRWDSLFPAFEYGKQAPRDPRPGLRHSGRTLPLSMRTHSQDEVVEALSAAEALEECERCLRCDLRTPVASGVGER